MFVCPLPSLPLAPSGRQAALIRPCPMLHGKCVHESNTTPCLARHATYIVGDDCGNCCRYVKWDSTYNHSATCRRVDARPEPARGRSLEFALVPLVFGTLLRPLVQKVPTMERRELLTPLLPSVQLYPEPLAERLDALARFFLLVFLSMLVFAHRLKAPSAFNFSRTAASTYSLWLIAAASAHLLTDSMVSGMNL